VLPAPNQFNVVVNWQTDEDADSTVEYGLNSAYGLHAVSTGFVKNHSVVVNGLVQGGVYHFRVLSADRAGNVGSSLDGTLSLQPPPNSAPMLTQVLDQTIQELTMLRITNVAVDADIPANTLTFSLDGASPMGMIIDPATGVLTWTPTEDQAPSTNIIVVKVMDDGNPPLSASRAFQVVATEVNQPPALAFIPNQNVPFGATLNVTANATDPDLPGNALAFGLLESPAGMTIDSASGLIVWTPSITQASSQFDVQVQVRDDGTPSLAATVTFQVSVGSANTAPVLNPISDLTINEGAPFSLQAVAVDHDSSFNTITFSLGLGAPAGMFIHPVSGLIAWTPTELQGPGLYTITVVASDDGSPSLSDQKSFKISVAEVNQAPKFSSVPDEFLIQTIQELTLLRITNFVVDADIPANTLTFSLDGASPMGMIIDPATGVLTWTPTEDQAPSTNIIFVKVTDDGNPPLSASRAFQVVATEVNQPPALAFIPNQNVLLEPRLM